MSRPPPLSAQFASQFRVWVRRDPRLFSAYCRLRVALHVLRWTFFHRDYLARLPRRTWDFLYWLPFRATPELWRNTSYGERAASGFPPAPLWRWVTRTSAFIRQLLTQAHLRDVGTFTQVRHQDALHLAARVSDLTTPVELTLEAPKVFGPPPPGWPLPWPPLQVRFPAITAAEWRSAAVAGKFDTVLVGRHCIVGDLWQAATERTFDEVRGYATVKGQTIRYRRTRTSPLSLDRAIVLVGGPTGNWAHWTTEYLPKLALIDELDRYRDWPLVIDEGLHANIIASLELVAGPRELVRLPEGVLLRLREAVSIGSPGYTAYEYRYDPQHGPPGFQREHTVFSPAALGLVRQRAWRTTGAAPRSERRIYIARPKGSVRPFVGGDRVERFFASRGFEVVDTSGMSAREQVQLFSTARCIAGQSGAGMTNLVFAPPGCRVVVFAANSPHSIFHYFANMGAAVGHHVYYVYGEALYDPGGHPGHAGFSIQLEHVDQAWKQICADDPDLSQ